eukprot:sb/3468672/
MYPTSFDSLYQYCGSAEENMALHNSTTCPPAVQSGMVEICRVRDITVLKVIRLQGLKELLRLPRIRDSGDVKIIHMVRHPVPMMMSRARSARWFYYRHRTLNEPFYESLFSGHHRVMASWEASTYCMETEETLKIAARDPWFRERYLRVRHEDISTAPLEWAARVYRHVGLQLTEEMERYMRDITTGQGGLERDPSLSVNKNSSELVHKWRELTSDRIWWTNVREIDSVCGGMMKQLGYTFDGENTNQVYSF